MDADTLGLSKEIIRPGGIRIRVDREVAAVEISTTVNKK
jgi:hypothetical protein